MNSLDIINSVYNESKLSVLITLLLARFTSLTINNSEACIQDYTMTSLPFHNHGILLTNTMYGNLNVCKNNVSSSSIDLCYNVNSPGAWRIS